MDVKSATIVALKRAIYKNKQAIRDDHRTGVTFNPDYVHTLILIVIL